MSYFRNSLFILLLATNCYASAIAPNGENFAWKRANLNETVMGGDSEGTIIRWVTTANKSIETANVILRIRPN